MPIAVAILSFLLFLSPLFAQSRRGGPGTGNPNEYLVPWTFLPKNGELIKAPLVLYWIPASAEELKRSPLLTSRALLDASGRCVGLQIVESDDAATIEKLGATGKLPAVVLAGAQGVVNRSGSTRPAVEKMLADELRLRDDAVFRALTDARTAASGGEKEKAVALYMGIWNDRCLYPLVGNEAQRGLRELGVTVREVPKPLTADPNTAATPAKKPQ